MRKGRTGVGLSPSIYNWVRCPISLISCLWLNSYWKYQKKEALLTLLHYWLKSQEWGTLWMINELQSMWFPELFYASHLILSPSDFNCHIVIRSPETSDIKSFFFIKDKVWRTAWETWEKIDLYSRIYFCVCTHPLLACIVAAVHNNTVVKIQSENTGSYTL